MEFKGKGWIQMGILLSCRSEKGILFFFWLSHWEADDRTYEKPPAVFAWFAAYAPQALKRHRLTQLPANDDVSGGGCQAQHGLGRRGKAIDSTRRFIENSERLVYPC